MVRVAAPGLRQIFSCCQGFTPNSDLLAWMKAHSQAPAANYVNWVGRTVRQIREEATLRDELVKCVKDRQDEFARDEPQASPCQAHCALPALTERRHYLADPRAAARRSAGPCAISSTTRSSRAPCCCPGCWPSPFSFHCSRCFSGSSLPFVALGAILFLFLIRLIPVAFAVIVVLGLWLVPLFILFPLLIVPVLLAVVVFLLVLRHYEKSEPEIIHRPEVDHILKLAALEDHDVTNQYTALGSVKPNRFRRGLFPVILWLIDYFARHVYQRGHLGRIRNIHFARWVFLDGKKRMIFASNYDGSHEAYMDDFINKAGWATQSVVQLRARLSAHPLDHQGRHRRRAEVQIHAAEASEADGDLVSRLPGSDCLRSRTQRARSRRLRASRR